MRACASGCRAMSRPGSFTTCGYSNNATEARQHAASNSCCSRPLGSPFRPRLAISHTRTRISLGNPTRLKNPSAWSPVSAVFIGSPTASNHHRSRRRESRPPRLAYPLRLARRLESASLLRRSSALSRVGRGSVARYIMSMPRGRLGRHPRRASWLRGFEKLRLDESYR